MTNPITYGPDPYQVYDEEMDTLTQSFKDLAKLPRSPNFTVTRSFKVTALSQEQAEKYVNETLEDLITSHNTNITEIKSVDKA